LSRFIPRDCMVEFRLFIEVRCSELGTGKTLATWTTSSIWPEPSESGWLRPYDSLVSSNSYKRPSLYHCSLA
jgi:hypothetical protein